MKTNPFIRLAIFSAVFLMLMANGSQLFAQQPAINCENLDFSYNSFFNWTGKTGAYTAQSPNPFMLSLDVTAFQMNAGVTSVNRHCSGYDSDPRRFMINKTLNEYDKAVFFNGNNKILSKIPPGYTHSVRLGNACNGGEAEALVYKFKVSEETALLTLMYSMVLQTPDHTGLENPSFDVKIREENPIGSGIYPDNTNTSRTKCTEFRATATIKDPKFVAPNDTTFKEFNNSDGGMLYRKWMPLVMNLKEFTGQNLEITISMGDCSQSGHYGYAYVAGRCGPAELQTGVFMQSNSDTTAFAIAPAGLTYRWVLAGTDPNDPNTRIYSTQQTVYLTDEDFDGKQQITLDCNTNMLVAEQNGKKGGCASVMSVTIPNKRPSIKLKANYKCSQKVSFDSTKVTKTFLNIDPTSHRWNFGDGNTSREEKPEHQYAEPGKYTVTYSVSTVPDTDPNAKDPKTGVPYVYTSTKTMEIKVRDSVKAVINGIAGVCPGDEITLSSQSKDPNALHLNSIGDTLKWIINGTDGSPIVLGKDTTFTRKYDNTETVYLTVSDTLNCSNTASHTVRVKPRPVIEIIGDSLTCMGNTISLTASSDNGVVYSWAHGKKGSTITEKPTQSSIYTVLVANDIGCASEKSIRVRLIVPTLSASTSKICPGDSVVLIASDAYAYEWSSMPNDASLVFSDASLTKAVAYPDQTTTYRMVGTGQNGCRADALTVRVEVYPYPIPTIENTPSTIDSDNPAILFNDRSPYGATSYWEFGDGTSSDRKSITHVYQDLSKDTIIVYLKSTNAIGCWRDTTKPLLVSLFSIWAPTAFTPEKDGPNQLFKFYSKNELTSFHLVILNRWGQKIFESNDINIAWDGTSGGKKLPADSYVWLMTYKRKDAERVYERKGHINLVR